MTNLRRAARYGASAALFALAMMGTARAELSLLMFEQPGCAYCRMWEAEIGPIYPKTPESAVAPLQMISLHKPLPEGLVLTRGTPRFTPTFVLVRDGTEIARLEGYPGEDFFWGMLGKMLEPQPEWQENALKSDHFEGN